MPRQSASALLSREVSALRASHRKARLLQRDKSVSRLISAIWSAVPLGAAPSVRISFYSGRPKLIIGITLSGLESFRGGLLPDVIEACMNAGVENWSSTDFPAFANRDYSGSTPHVSVSIQAYLDTASAECVRVKVGERLEPVYELRCA